MPRLLCSAQQHLPGLLHCSWQLLVGEVQPPGLRVQPLSVLVHLHGVLVQLVSIVHLLRQLRLPLALLGLLGLLRERYHLQQPQLQNQLILLIHLLGQLALHHQQQRLLGELELHLHLLEQLQLLAEHLH